MDSWIEKEYIISFERASTVQCIEIIARAIAASEVAPIDPSTITCTDTGHTLVLRAHVNVSLEDENVRRRVRQLLDYIMATALKTCYEDMVAHVSHHSIA